MEKMFCRFCGKKMKGHKALKYDSCYQCKDKDYLKDIRKTLREDMKLEEKYNRRFKKKNANTS